MEEEPSVLPNFDETHQCHQGFHRFRGKKCLKAPDNLSEQTSASLGEDKLKINNLQMLAQCFSSDTENITNNNSVISDDSTVCAMKPFNYSNLIKCEKELLGSNDEEKSFELEKVPVNYEKLLQISKKFTLHNDTISTPPSALREQISMLRKEMNEAYEFHDLEIQILKEEEKKKKKEDPESYATLIEKYSNLLELYSSLKTEYEEYRREQEKIRNELQCETVNCLESLCSQIETSDNSLNCASFVSFNTDFKCSTMIDNFTEKEATLLHDVTIQTKDPLSNTDILKTLKLTPFKSVNKSFFQNFNQKDDPCTSKYDVKFTEVETALNDKAKELEKLEQRLFKIEDLSGLLQNEFERISTMIRKENETLKQNLLNKSEQLDVLTQKLFTEIISLNPSLMDRLADAPGTKLLPVLIETIMERCKNIQDKLIMKFNIDKSDLEVKVQNFEEKNKDLNDQVFALQELNNSRERQLLEIKNTVLTRDEEIRILKIQNFNVKQMQDDLDLAKEEVKRLEAQLSLTANCGKEAENKCLVLEQTNYSLRLELEEIKKFCESTKNDNTSLKERLCQIMAEKSNLQEACEKLKRELSLKEEVIFSRDQELENFKNKEMKQMEVALTQADEVLLRVKTDLLTTQNEKINFERRCMELENTNSSLQDLIISKDIILKGLEEFKFSYESQWENIQQQIQEKEMTISELKLELNTIKEKHSVAEKKTESLNAEINSYKSEVAEKQKCFKDIEGELLNAESKIKKLEEEIQTLQSHEMNIRQIQDDLASAKEEVKRLEAQLSLTANCGKEAENKCLVLEQTNYSLRLELEEIKKFCESTENDNTSLKERLCQITAEKSNLQEACEKLKRELSLKEEVIFSRDQELENFKNKEIKQMEVALTQADEVLLRVKTDLLTTQNEKINFERRCMELENTNSSLQDLIISKDIILKDLEEFKFSYESQWENIQQQIQEKEMTIAELKLELNTIKEKHSVAEKKTESLNAEINSYKSEVAEKQKCFKDLEGKLLNAESKIKKLEEEIQALQSHEMNIRQIQDDLVSAKEINERLRAALLITESGKKKLEDRCQVLEEKCSSMCLDLDRIKFEYRSTEIENENCINLIHQNNTEVDFEGLFETLMEGLEKLKLSSVGNLPKIINKAMVHLKKLQSRTVELKEENHKLDEECDSYAKVIKDLKKEAAVEWKKNNEKIQTFEEEIMKLTEMKNDLEGEKKELLGKIKKLEDEFQRQKANILSEGRSCGCEVDLKKLNELKRGILVKEQKLLELQDIEAQNNSYKSQIEYLKNALDKERKKNCEEREKYKKLQNEMVEATRNQKTENKKFEDNQILEELRMRGSISGGVVGEIVDKEKMRKLSKDVGLLKEICRTRYAEIKRLEAENAALKSFTTKNSNQMDSPIRSRGYDSRSKLQVVEKWKTEVGGKENRAV